MTTTGILPLHHGTVLVPMEQFPNIVTKNANDGELIQLHTGVDGFDVSRRNEYDISWSSDGGYQNWQTAVGTLADRQGFGYRQDGSAAGLHNIDPHANVLEIEPLNRGGILLEELDQLPVGFYLNTAESYRLRTVDDVPPDVQGTLERIGDSPAVVLEYRQDNQDTWKAVEYAGVHGLDYLCEVLSDRTGIVATDSPSSTNMKEIIQEEYDGSFDSPFDLSEQEIADRMAIASDTAIPPSFPPPARLFA
jgi:hypothetical protein